jgi:hypothetical protein
MTLLTLGTEFCAANATPNPKAPTKRKLQSWQERQIIAKPSVTHLAQAVPQKNELVYRRRV